MFGNSGAKEKVQVTILRQNCPAMVTTLPTSCKFRSSHLQSKQRISTYPDKSTTLSSSIPATFEPIISLLVINDFPIMHAYGGGNHMRGKRAFCWSFPEFHQSKRNQRDIWHFCCKKNGTLISFQAVVSKTVQVELVKISSDPIE